MKQVFVLFLVALIGCKTQPIVNQSITDKTLNKSLTYLALGDSYTIGESVPENERWPVQLADKLSKNGVLVSSPRIIAKTGWTTDELKVGIAATNVLGTYDLVSLLIGVNNQYRGRDAEQFRTEFNGLLDQAVGFAGGNAKKVFVVSIPDWGVTPFAKGRDQAKVAKEIDAYNAIKKTETEKRGILYVDITPISRQATSDTTLIANDGLHPSGKMYGLWVEQIVPVLSERLK